MANNLADYAENKVLEHSLGKTSWTMPTAYIALFTTNPAEDGTGGTEVSGGSYARFTSSGATWGAASGGTISNAVDILFTGATASWGTIVGYGIYDAATGGNLIWLNTLTASKAIGSGDTARFTAGQLSFTAS
jgi:hypothetical protein